MIDVTVKITAIIMYCDESILNLELGNGYTIEKCYYDDFPFKSEIENGKNQLCIEYIGSRLHDENGSYFICNVIYILLKLRHYLLYKKYYK